MEKKPTPKMAPKVKATPTPKAAPKMSPKSTKDMTPQELYKAAKFANSSSKLGGGLGGGANIIHEVLLHRHPNLPTSFTHVYDSKGGKTTFVGGPETPAVKKAIAEADRARRANDSAKKSTTKK